jgi:hypothetical protein
MTIEHNFAFLPMYRPSASSGNARAPSAPELPDTYALEPMFGSMSIPDRRPPASVPVQAPRAPARREWSVMDENMALVSCEGKWIPAMDDQLVVIKMGEDATTHMQMFEEYRTEPVGGYQYVIEAGGSKRFIKNVKTRKCRQVLIVPKPTFSWEERR